MNKIFIYILLSLISFNINAENTLSKKEFTEKYVLVTLNKIEGLKGDIKGNLEIEFTAKGGKKSTTFLDNAYNNYLSNPADLDLIIDRYSTSLEETISGTEKAFGVDNIFPVIKDQKYIQQITELMNKKGEARFPFYYEQLNESLYVLYAIDTPSSIQFIHEDKISELGIKKSDLRSISKDNLKKAIPSLDLQGDPSSLSMIIADGNYEASFLLFNSMWTKDQFPVKGDIVVYVPSRDTVLITGSEDEEGLSRIKEIISDPENNWSHIVAEVGFIRINDKWEVYK